MERMANMADVFRLAQSCAKKYKRVLYSYYLISMVIYSNCVNYNSAVKSGELIWQLHSIDNILILHYRSNLPYIISRHLIRHISVYVSCARVVFPSNVTIQINQLLGMRLPKRWNVIGQLWCVLLVYTYTSTEYIQYILDHTRSRTSSSSVSITAGPTVRLIMADTHVTDPIIIQCSVNLSYSLAFVWTNLIISESRLI